MSVPPALQYFASRLSDYETLPVTLDPMNSRVEFGESDVIEFELPSSSLINLDSLRVTFAAECLGDAAGGGDRLPNDIHKMLHRVEVSCAGELLGHAYNEMGRLKGLLDAITGTEPHPTSHPKLLRLSLNAASPAAVTKAAKNKAAAVAAALAAIPPRIDSTTHHLHLKADLTAPNGTVAPVGSTINIIGKFSATKLVVCAYDATNYKLFEANFTWAELAPSLELDAANLVGLFNLLGFENYSVTQSVADEIATAVAAHQAALDISNFANETADEIGDTRFCWESFGGFLQTCQPRTIDTAVLPPLIIRLFTATRECISNSELDTSDEVFGLNSVAPGGYRISKPRLSFDSISFGNGAYDSYISSILSRKMLQIPFKTYRHFQSQAFVNNIDISSSTRSLDRIMFALSNRNDRKIDSPVQMLPDIMTTLPSLVATAPEQVFSVAEKYLATRYMHQYDGEELSNEAPVSADPAVQFQINLNGALYPPRPYEATDWFVNTTAALSEMRNPWNPGLSYAQWLTQSALCVFRLNRTGSTVQSASGLDTRNSQLAMQLNTPDGLPEERVIDVWLESTALLTVFPGRDFVVEM